MREREESISAPLQRRADFHPENRIAPLPYRAPRKAEMLRLRWNFGWIFKRMVRDEASTSQLCVVLDMEAWRCDFRGKNRLDAGAVLKCFPRLSLSYYSQVNAERKTSKTPIFAILSCKDDKTQQMR